MPKKTDELALTIGDPVADVPAAQTPMALIQLAVAANADPYKLEKLMALQERWEDRRAAERFAEALAAFQAECPPIVKRRDAAFNGRRVYSFASLDDIMAVAQPLLCKHGLSVSHSADLSGDGALHAVCRVRCGSHVDTSEITLPVPREMKVNATQQMGAAMSYAKRYAVCNALGITVTDEDTDAAQTDDPVTQDQADELRGIADGMGGDTAARFLRWIGVEHFKDIPASRYADAKVKLQSKAAQ